MKALLDILPPDVWHRGIRFPLCSPHERMNVIKMLLVSCMIYNSVDLLQQKKEGQND